jgi:hypothetical protein
MMAFRPSGVVGVAESAWNAVFRSGKMDLRANPRIESGDAGNGDASVRRPEHAGPAALQ